ncbi:P-loop containing nucleoside triphosphate hydrolase protein [Gonapodya prolifera JEL478]|uniref:p-loop containing nucleoside triphosphate hydrolase protein n=1 Tax=Gonapodya prolifera (strain JEL478) TaxID=1344416 RepID=A0A139A9H3_GONPJ|nr:P-loop containing nucleoside triphosphate hydrolase protein [Gonapodya prolifera JEL478]|eukprot:KXS13416.1 P-loop containing nucleoside triphosphate hydrolase protein [Gonapodya prolifera JEL478]
MNDESVRVLIRPRPLLPSETRSQSFTITGNTIAFAAEESTGRKAPDLQKFKFDHIGGESSSQEEVWDTVGKDACERLLDGFNASVLYYGQTGTGKTYTMMGTPTHKGILPRAIDHIFARLTDLWAISPTSDAVVWVSYIDLRKDNIHDLLRPVSRSGSAVSLCSVREDIKSGVWVEGCLEEPCLTAATAHRLLRRGTSARTTATTTAATMQSTGSHAIFTLTLRRTMPNTVGGYSREAFESKIQFVDLAGSGCETSVVTQGNKSPMTGGLRGGSGDDNRRESKVAQPEKWTSKTRPPKPCNPRSFVCVRKSLIYDTRRRCLPTGLLAPPALYQNCHSLSLFWTLSRSGERGRSPSLWRSVVTCKSRTGSTTSPRPSFLTLTPPRALVLLQRNWQSCLWAVSQLQERRHLLKYNTPIRSRRKIWLLNQKARRKMATPQLSTPIPEPLMVPLLISARMGYQTTLITAPRLLMPS